MQAAVGWSKGPITSCAGHPAGKSHLVAAIGLALIENGWRVLFARTSDLVQRLQVARRELTLEYGSIKAHSASVRSLAQRNPARRYRCRAISA